MYIVVEVIDPEPMCSMILILDDNSEHVAHAYRKIGLFGVKLPICDVLDISKCL